ncbi:MAG: DNA repair protein RecN [Candidatus Nitronauta litoralis]|uniref:DNA repair protein RecN n=1 Tax=Candidatus Nitronauta litoralis TaxID=2705533 RepID=A0A7T0FZK3_9BACT|nr:MAG: DNA repair protein RecN [Candidatus Nitronauta litoralis]
MLEEIRIKHFAIIDQLEVGFHPGLNVLTGETGAGKSIIIGALNLVVGGRADTDSIRTGQDSATVEAVFQIDDPETVAWAQDLGIEPEEGRLIVRRVLSQKDKNRVFLNGISVTVSQLTELGRRLVDIHGQHDHQSLFHPETHVELLDRFGGLEQSRNEFDEAFRLHQGLASKLKQIEKNQSHRLQRQDLLKFQIGEIDSAGLHVDEEEELSTEKNKLRHAETLHRAMDQALNALSETPGSVLEVLGQIRRDLEPLPEIDPQLSSLDERSNNAFYEAEALAEEVRDYLKSIEFNPERLEEIEDRLAEINGLKRKYGIDIPSILEYRETIGEELDSLSLSEEQVGDLKKELKQAESVLAKMACKLAEDREQAAAKLKKGAEKELKDLEMKNVVFEVRFDYPTDPNSFVKFRKEPVRLNPNGLGMLEFMFSPNPGETPKPLAKIASGGEISRVMLALKSILQKQSKVPVMVFDEVDAGISGKVAEKVGAKLKKISKDRQVFCITHLPQIAGLGGTHFRVHKTVADKRTQSTIQELDYDQRVEEIARMSGGEKITKATLEHAKEMIK